MDLDIKEIIAKVICNSNYRVEPNIKEYKSNIQVLMNLLKQEYNGNNNLQINVHDKNNILKILNRNLVITKRLLRKFCKYRKEILTISNSVDKLLSNQIEKNIFYTKLIIDFFQANDEKNILFKGYFKNILNDLNQKVLIENTQVMKSIIKNEAKVFMKKIYKFLKISMKDKYFHTKFVDFKNEEIRILKKLSQSQDIMLNFENLNISFIISDTDLQDYNILSLFDSKNSAIDRVIDNSDDIINIIYRFLSDKYGNINLLKKNIVSVEDIIYNLTFFIDRNNLISMKLDHDIEEYDMKIYVQDCYLTNFIIDEFKHILVLLNLNTNVIKLYETIHYSDFVTIEENIFYKIWKISRTPAFGVKNIIMGNDKINFILKPIQVIFLIYTQFFADLVINEKIKNKSLLCFLNSINYNKYFYIQNYQHFIPKLYVLNKKINKNDESRVFLQTVSNVEMITLLYYYFGININNFTLQIFEQFNMIKNFKQFDLKLILFTRNNENKMKNNYLMVCNFYQNLERNSDIKLQSSCETNLIYNNICSLSKNPLISISKFQNETLRKFLFSCYENSMSRENITNLLSPINEFKTNSIVNISDIYLFYLNIKKVYNDKLERKILLSKELNVKLLELEKQSKDAFRKISKNDIFDLLQIYKNTRNETGDTVKITSVLIEILEPIVSYRKTHIGKFQMNRKLGQRDNSIDTSQDKSQIEDNENSIKIVKRNSVNMISKNLEKKPSFRCLNKSDLKTLSYMNKNNENNLKISTYVTSQNFKTNNTPQFPNIIRKRPTTVSSTSKNIRNNGRNEIIKKAYNLNEKHNSFFLNSKSNNAYLNNSFLKKSNNELSKKNFNAVEKEKQSLIKKVSSGSLKKQILKNLDYLIYKSNKI